MSRCCAVSVLPIPSDSLRIFQVLTIVPAGASGADEDGKPADKSRFCYRLLQGDASGSPQTGWASHGRRAAILLAPSLPPY